MSRDARKKQKHRLKRKQKQIEARKAKSVTPLDRIARSGGVLECYVNDDWTETGIASIQVLGRAADGGCAHAAFLVDVWCVGLKDAYGSRTALRSEFENLLERLGERMHMGPIPAEVARRLVAGGVRFARQNGFHLPSHSDRWTAIFGDLGDVASADLTDFGVEGNGRGLRYVGTLDFLKRRLAHCSAEQFLARPDVHWMLSDGTPANLAHVHLSDDDQDLGDDEDDDDLDFDTLDPEGEDAPILAVLENMVGGVADRTEDAIRKWCFQTGRAPHPRLREALDTMLVSTLPLAMQGQLEEEVATPESPPPAVPHPTDLIRMGLEQMPADERLAVAEAMDQVTEYMNQFSTPQAMLTAMRLPPPGGGDFIQPA